MPVALALSVLLLVLAAGCTGAKPKPQQVVSTAPPATHGEDSGGINGLVVDDEYRPVAGAGVTVVGTNLSAQTDAGGRFSFSNLQPVDYFVIVKAQGYYEKKTGFTARVGESTNVTITLLRILPPSPYHNTRVFRGTINCQASVTGYNPGALCQGTLYPQNMRSTNVAQIDQLLDPVHEILWELQWTPQNAAANKMLLEMQFPCKVNPYAICHGSPFTATGPHVLRLDVKYDQLHAFVKNATDVYPITEKGDPSHRIGYRVSVAPGMLGTAVDVGAGVEQDFTLYSTIGFNGPLPEGYSGMT